VVHGGAEFWGLLYLLGVFFFFKGVAHIEVASSFNLEPTCSV